MRCACGDLPCTCREATRPLGPQATPTARNPSADCAKWEGTGSDWNGGLPRSSCVCASSGNACTACVVGRSLSRCSVAPSNGDSVLGFTGVNREPHTLRAAGRFGPGILWIMRQTAGSDKLIVCGASPPPRAACVRAAASDLHDRAAWLRETLISGASHPQGLRLVAKRRGAASSAEMCSRY